MTTRHYEQELRGDEDFYSATPPACTLKVALVLAQRREHVVAVADSSGAFLQADVAEKVWVDPPALARELEGRVADEVWLPRTALPGLNGVLCAWTDYSNEVVKERHGFKQAVSDSTAFWHSTRQLFLVRHVDDVLITGPLEEVKAFLAELAERLQVDQSKVLAEPGDRTMLLGSVLEQTKKGYRLTTSQTMAKECAADWNMEDRRSEAATRRDEARRARRRPGGRLAEALAGGIAACTAQRRRLRRSGAARRGRGLKAPSDPGSRWCQRPAMCSSKAST